MSEMNNRTSRDYSKYDSMSTEQLQAILRLDAHLNEGEGMDTEELFYVMEVLTVRRKSNPETAGKSTQEAYREFQEHYMPKEETKMIRFPMWLRRAATVAAVLAIFLATATVSVNAFGYDLWGKVAVWSQEFFHFEDETQGTEGEDPDKKNNYGYASLQDALDGSGITQKLAPTWFPDGYTLLEVSLSNTPRETSIHASYTNNRQTIRVSIRWLIGTKPEEIEKSDNYIMTYDANGIAYYIFENNNNLQATWVVGEFEGLIIGNVTLEEMKAIIDSI